MANENNAGAAYYPPYFYPWYPAPETAKAVPVPPPVNGHPPYGYPPVPPGYPPLAQSTPEAQQLFAHYAAQQHALLQQSLQQSLQQQAQQAHLAQQAAYAHYQHHAAPVVDWSEKAQGMVEEMMGEQAGLLKNIISTIGADDKEFWKGAMIGAAAVLLLTNDSVRNLLLQTVCGAGDLLKTGGSKVKETVMSGAGTIKETAAASSSIFCDTLKAGKQGFQQSVERHRQPPVTPASESGDSHDEQQP